MIRKGKVPQFGKDISHDEFGNSDQYSPRKYKINGSLDKPQKARDGKD